MRRERERTTARRSAEEPVRPAPREVGAWVTRSTTGCSRRQVAESLGATDIATRACRVQARVSRPRPRARLDRAEAPTRAPKRAGARRKEPDPALRCDLTAAPLG